MTLQTIAQNQTTKFHTNDFVLPKHYLSAAVGLKQEQERNRKGDNEGMIQGHLIHP